MFDPASKAMQPYAIVGRDMLSPGDQTSGPAVIVQRETSTVITTCFNAVMQSDGAILLVRKGGGKRAR